MDTALCRLLAPALYDAISPHLLLLKEQFDLAQYTVKMDGLLPSSFRVQRFLL